MFGYSGRIALINLSDGTIKDYPIKEEDYALYVGGKTLAAKIIYDAFDHPVEAFSDENLIVITTSPFTGSTAACSSRFNISTISPLTGLLISSNSGGSFGLNLRRAGYDGLIITGRSDEPVYIDIEKTEIKIKSATHLWGLSTSQTHGQLGAKNRGKLAIGIAGENLVRYALVMSEERASGRGGVGAIFGHKKLKGIVASGDNTLELYDKEAFKKLNMQWIKQLRAHPMTGERLPQYGTAGLVRTMQKKHLLATKNFSSGRFEDYERLSGERLAENQLIRNKGCMTCPIQCGRQVKLNDKLIKGPELETIGLLGSNLMNADMDNIIRLNHVCDEVGIDTISFGGSVGFAMELNEKGIWKNGLNFGDNTKLEELVALVAKREGIGADIAEGTRRMAEKYGGSDYAIHVKGLETAAYEPRAAQGMGLGYATSNRGGCHLNGGYMVVMEGLGLDISGQTTRSKAVYTVFFQDLMEAVSAAGTCLFTTYALLPPFMLGKANVFTKMVNGVIPYTGGLIALVKRNTWLLSFNISSILPFPKLLHLITGQKMTIGQFIDFGERGYNLERLINLRQGLTSSGDTLPKRLLKELQRSDEPNSVVKLEEMLKTYYKIRGWDLKGVPTEKTLIRLKIQ